MLEMAQYCEFICRRPTCSSVIAQEQLLRALRDSSSKAKEAADAWLQEWQGSPRCLLTVVLTVVSAAVLTVVLTLLT